MECGDKKTGWQQQIKCVDGQKDHWGGEVSLDLVMKWMNLNEFAFLCIYLFFFLAPKVLNSRGL